MRGRVGNGPALLFTTVHLHATRSHRPLKPVIVPHFVNQGFFGRDNADSPDPRRTVYPVSSERICNFQPIGYKARVYVYEGLFFFRIEAIVPM